MNDRGPVGGRSSGTRRRFLELSAATSAAIAILPAGTVAQMPKRSDMLTLFLCGDVMLGRGVDQILPHPGDPELHEPYVASATTYVELAEKVHGPIPGSVDRAYVWGDALDTLRQVQPDARIINLETSITDSRDPAPKGINYKMHPANVPVLTAADVDCCVLANNHVLDWGVRGLLDTLETLEEAGIKNAGAGRNAGKAAAPAILPTDGKGRVLVFAFGATSSGIPRQWAAAKDKPGVDLLEDLSDRTVAAISERVRTVKDDGDLAVASIHWGGNWGYEIPPEQTRFARGLIDEAGFDVVHGHSSHHPKAIEIYRGKPILYGCGDFLNDYEGIVGVADGFRDDLAVMYLPRFDAASRQLTHFRLEVFLIRKFRLERASREDTAWLADVLDRESSRFDTRIELQGDNRLQVAWQ